jgi:hypothetical protein
VAPDILNASFPDGIVRRAVVQEYTKLITSGFNWTILEYTGSGGGVQPYLWDTRNYPASFVSRWYEMHGATVVREGVGATHGFLRLGLDFVNSPANPDAGYGPWDNFGESAGEHAADGSFRGCDMDGVGLTTNLVDFLDAACFEPVVVRDAIPGMLLRRDYLAWATNLQQCAGGTSSNLPGRYVDDTQATAGEFIGFTNALPEITTTGLWARLAIGDRTNKWTHDLTNSYVVTLTNWTELYRVANALRWTHVNAAGGLVWNANTTTVNGMAWDSGWTDTLANAKAACAAAPPTPSTNDYAAQATAELRQMYDWSGTYGAPSSWVYRATFTTTSNTMLTVGLCTNIKHDVEFYIQTQLPDSFTDAYALSNNQYIAYNSGVATNGVLTRVAVYADQWGESVSNNVNDLSFGPGAWPESPTTFRGTTPPDPTDPDFGLTISRGGWRIYDYDAVAKWHFTGATNAP